MRILLFVVGMLILIVFEILKVYYIMPFPGSQADETIRLAYFIHNNIWWIRIVGLAIAAIPAYHLIKSSNVWSRWPAVVVIGFWLVVVYNFNFRFLADKMFRQPKLLSTVAAGENKVPGRNLVVGVTVNGTSKAYPIEIIGYHHQVRDNIGGEEVMITYCTVCRTGRVFKPLVDGQLEDFRLVGMDHFNAMFEDSRTKSWWRQVNGVAIVGDLEGKQLEEIPSSQMSLDAWVAGHPDTFVMQPDTNFTEIYKGLVNYDEGKDKNGLERKDSVSWGEKSWVVGVQLDDRARAYDWIELLKVHLVNDTLKGVPILVAIDKDSASFHAWRRPDSLMFAWDAAAGKMKDTNTNSVWNEQGVCVEGKLQGSRLEFQQSYQEFWHSWRTFRPQTSKYAVSQ